ncbi:MAG: asparagine--tRNA ligase, partial [Flavobacteriales bacterium]|nr:asparagine--tRNA ligase [Flavobacteriales bacterium]
MKRTKVKSLLSEKAKGQEICVKGWVRTRRGSKNVSFIALNDGSTINNIQIVAEGDHFDEEILKKITTGSAISIIGILVESKGGGQNVEVLAATIEILGEA